MQCKRMEYIYGGHSLFFGDWLHIRCPQGVRSGYCSSRRETKSVVKSVVQRDQPTNHPSNPPNQPTSQKQNLSGPGWGKESTKAQAVRETFFSGLIFRSLSGPGVLGATIGLNRAHKQKGKNVTSVQRVSARVIFTEFY
jgi:hypothetical protein